jgi:hypothetical protein
MTVESNRHWSRKVVLSQEENQEWSMRMEGKSRHYAQGQEMLYSSIYLLKYLVINPVSTLILFPAEDQDPARDQVHQRQPILVLVHRRFLPMLISSRLRGMYSEITLYPKHRPCDAPIPITIPPLHTFHHIIPPRRSVVVDRQSLRLRFTPPHLLIAFTAIRILHHPPPLSGNTSDHPVAARRYSSGQGRGARVIPIYITWWKNTSRAVRLMRRWSMEQGEKWSVWVYWENRKMRTSHHCSCSNMHRALRFISTVRRKPIYNKVDASTTVRSGYLRLIKIYHRFVFVRRRLDLCQFRFRLCLFRDRRDDRRSDRRETQSSRFIQPSHLFWPS